MASDRDWAGTAGTVDGEGGGWTCTASVTDMKESWEGNCHLEQGIYARHVPCGGRKHESRHASKTFSAAHVGIGSHSDQPADGVGSTDAHDVMQPRSSIPPAANHQASRLRGGVIVDVVNEKGETDRVREEESGCFLFARRNAPFFAYFIHELPCFFAHRSEAEQVAEREKLDTIFPYMPG